MNNKLFNVGLACGGTGGHISPALALMKDFKNFNLNPYFFTDIRGTHILKSYSYSVILSGSPSTKGIKRITNLLKMIIGIFQSIYFLYKNNINLVIGFGGYSSVPIIVAAKLLRIPSIIHEQNKIIGKANKFCSSFCNKIALSFDLKTKSSKSDKYVITGNPVSKDFEKIGDKKFEPISKQRITILVIGGSQGTKIFSEIIPKVIQKLPKKIKDKIFIFQQCRNEDKDKVKLFYEQKNIKFDVKTFFSEIYNIFEKADLIISRSGGSTISEISAAGRPSILIPFPFSAEDHQKENALEFQKNNACVLLEQKELNEKVLLDKLVLFLSNKNLLSDIALNARSLYKKNSSEKITNLVISILNGEIK